MTIDEAIEYFKKEFPDYVFEEPSEKQLAYNTAIKALEELKDKDCSKCSRRSWYQKGYVQAIGVFETTLIPRLTDAIYEKDVKSMINLINDVVRELKAGEGNVQGKT